MLRVLKPGESTTTLVGMVTPTTLGRAQYDHGGRGGLARARRSCIPEQAVDFGAQPAHGQDGDDRDQGDDQHVLDEPGASLMLTQIASHAARPFLISPANDQMTIAVLVPTTS